MQLQTASSFILRDFTQADLAAYAALRDDAKFQRFYPESDRSIEKAQFLLDLFIAQSQENPRSKFQLAITAPDGELIGSIGLRIEAPGVASMGCELARRWQKSGAAQEAARCIAHHGFTVLGLQRLYAETIQENKAAIRLCQSLGMQIESERVNDQHFKGRDWTTVVLAISAQQMQALDTLAR